MTTIAQCKNSYNSLYSQLVYSEKIVSDVNDMWDGWEKQSGETRPNVQQIAENTREYNELFFKEVVDVASIFVNEKLNIEYLAFITNEYNLSAITAEDGYLVLIDEAYFAMLSYIIFGLMFDVDGYIGESEKVYLKSEIYRMIECYLNYKELERDMSFHNEIIKKSYETAEHAVYLFNSIIIYMIAHEISHLILKHRNGKKTNKKNWRGTQITYETDKRDIQCEFEADIYAYKIFHKIIHTTDNSVDKIFCKYQFEFAPLFLFDISEKLEKASKYLSENNSELYTSTHPPASERKRNLLNNFDIFDDTRLYDLLLEKINSFFG